MMIYRFHSLYIGSKKRAEGASNFPIAGSSIGTNRSPVGSRPMSVGVFLSSIATNRSSIGGNSSSSGSRYATIGIILSPVATNRSSIGANRSINQCNGSAIWQTDEPLVVFKGISGIRFQNSHYAPVVYNSNILNNKIIIKRCPKLY